MIKRTGADMLVTLLHWCKNYASTNISRYLQNFYVCVQDNYGLIVKILTTANNKENQQTKENLFWSVKRNNFNLAISLWFSVQGKANTALGTQTLRAEMKLCLFFSSERAEMKLCPFSVWDRNRGYKVENLLSDSIYHVVWFKL